MHAKAELDEAYAMLRLWRSARANGRIPAWLPDVPRAEYLDITLMGALMNHEVLRVAQALGRDMPTDRPVTVGVSAVQKIHWALAGAPVFQLTQGATAAFVLTDTAGLTWADLQLPFPHFVVSLPRPGCPVVFSSATVDCAEVDAITVSRAMIPVPTRGGPDLAEAAVHQLNEILTRGGGREAFERLRAECGSVPMLWVGGDAAQDAKGIKEGVHRSFPIPDPTTPLAGWIGGDGQIPSEWESDRSRHAMGLLCRIVACLCVYLDGSGTAQGMTAERRARNVIERKPTFATVGSEIKLPMPLRDAARALGLADRNRAGWTLKAHTHVRGHFKLQAHGPRLALRKKIFVEPYERGDLATDAIQKLYKVGT